MAASSPSTTRRIATLRGSGIPAILLVCLAAGPAAGQDPNARNRECIEAYTRAAQGTDGYQPIDASSAGQLAAGCRLVASFSRTRWESADFAGSLVDPTDVAATRGQTTVTPGQAAPTVEPVEAAGGSVAAVGTKEGTGAVTALAVNPAVFFVDPSDTQQVAAWSRFTDFTLLVPLDNPGSDEADEDVRDGIEYVGVRWGLNVNGLAQGQALHDAVVAAYQGFLSAASQQTQTILRLLQTLPAEGLEPCIRLLRETGGLDDAAVARITLTCGGSPVATDASVLAALRGAIRAARIQADSRYLGLDVRADFGDLSLAGVDTVRGRSLYTGIGLGRRFGTTATTGFRAQAGVRLWDSEVGEEAARIAIEGGLAFESIRYSSYQRLAFVGGLDFHHRTAGPRSGSTPTSVNLKGSINIPVTSTTSVSLNLATPLSGEIRGPVLSVNGNWRLLFSESF